MLDSVPLSPHFFWYEISDTSSPTCVGFTFFVFFVDGSGAGAEVVTATTGSCWATFRFGAMVLKSRKSCG